MNLPFPCTRSIRTSEGRVLLSLNGEFTSEMTKKYVEKHIKPKVQAVYNELMNEYYALGVAQPMHMPDIPMIGILHNNSIIEIDTGFAAANKYMVRLAEGLNIALPHQVAIGKCA